MADHEFFKIERSNQWVKLILPEAQREMSSVEPRRAAGLTSPGTVPLEPFSWVCLHEWLPSPAFEVLSQTLLNTDHKFPKLIPRNICVFFEIPSTC